MLKNVVIPLARDNLSGLVSNLFLKQSINLKEKQVEKELLEQEKGLLYSFRMKI